MERRGQGRRAVGHAAGLVDSETGIRGNVGRSAGSAKRVARVWILGAEVRCAFSSVLAVGRRVAIRTADILRHVSTDLGVGQRDIADIGSAADPIVAQLVGGRSRQTGVASSTGSASIRANGDPCVRVFFCRRALSESYVVARLSISKSAIASSCQTASTRAVRVRCTEEAFPCAAVAETGHAEL